MPVDRLAWERGRRVAQHGGETHTVERVAGARSAADEVQQRRIHVDVRHRDVARAAGGHDAGPADDEWDARAAFVEGALAATERRIVGESFFIGRRFGALVAAEAAVVGGENDDGVVGEFEFFEAGHDAADAFVDALNHGGVGGIPMRALGPLLFPRGDVVGLRLNRRVHGEMRHVEEKRPVAVATDEVHGAVGDEVGEILTGRIVGGRDGGEIEMFVVGDERFVEAATARMVVAGVAEMPFAEHARGITGGLKRLR